MERTILFRGKVKYNGNHLFFGDWVYGDLLQIAGGCVIYHGSKTKCTTKQNEGSAIELFANEISVVIPETIGEYTGLKDKNGVGIFSDDLLKDRKGNIFRIYQIAGGFCIKSSVWKTDINDFYFTDILIAASLTDAQMQSYILESCEIIGNIHDKHVL